ncbi:hypothetical protein BKA66DRAFT_567138 [Pyrenochaeta sp. MPI-SDFR-AT-0127]|nr:hypothetical protein BKA66DRAFT_567138 [Pyrenochaeta sp. MPI-SDFR-AT-0127]
MSESPQRPCIGINVSCPEPLAVRHKLHEARVAEVGLLSRFDGTTKRHMEIRLPSNMLYSARDCLSEKNVLRAMKYFNISRDSALTVFSTSSTAFPTGTPISAAEVFGAYIEPAQPATSRDIQALLDATRDEKTRELLAHLAGETFSKEVVAKRISVLDLRERFLSVRVSLDDFLKMQLPMQIRQYCISLID